MKKLCLMFVVAILIGSSWMSVRAHSGNVLMVANGSAPTVDGSIGSTEWADSSILVFTHYTVSATVYAKQDGSNLYIAVDRPEGTPYDEDLIGLSFDVNHDGGSNLQSDDMRLMINRLSSTLQENLANTFGDWGAYLAPSGWTAAGSSTATAFKAEFSISFSKIGVTAGVPKTLGILLYFEDKYPTDTGTNKVWCALPTSSGSSYETPNVWADIIVGNPNFVVPEFRLGIVLGLTGCLAAFGTFFIAHTHSKRKVV